MKSSLSLYVHIPWCVRKCPYCDFNSHEAAHTLPENDYVEALLLDLESDVEYFNPKDEIGSVFFGGGTPSLLSPGAVERFLAGAKRILSFSPSVEITLEANPGTVSEGATKFSGFVDAGINRLSLGVQSFTDRHLVSLGRIHSADEARAAFGFAREAGIDNINLDLMHGLPGQDLDCALSDLVSAISLSPEHISWYQLTIEPNTVFHKRPPSLPDEDTMWQIFETGAALLQSHGFGRYEISAFAQNSRSCRHNLNYWQFGDYLGVGAGAHGKLTLRDHIVRTRKTRLPKDYLERPRRTITTIEQSDIPVEFLMNALRLCGGFDPDTFESRTGLPPSVLRTFTERASARQLLEVADGRIRPTALGLQFLNTLLLMAMDEDVIAYSKSGTSTTQGRSPHGPGHGRAFRTW